ncbi:hypothetical protein V2A60_005015 [Cordyceps javanica]
MAVLGKRKARESGPSSSDVSALDAEAIFRRHFEAQFEPLDDEKEDRAARARRELDDDDDAIDSDRDGDEEDEEGLEEGSDEDAEWGGLSSGDDDDGDGDDGEEEEEEAPIVQVIDHSKPQVPKEPRMSKKELKAFMSSKVIDHSAPTPSSSTSSSSDPPSSKATKASLPEDAPSLLAQDLELRRLLAESHLLTPSHNNAASASVFSSSVVHSASGAAPKAFASGRTRHKATDLRLQALGSKTSVLAQERMPMHMRKGIVAAAGAREAKRRREARENGVILERKSGSVGVGGAKKKNKGSSGGGGGGGGGRARQERGVNGPGIGRMRGAELRISESDVRKIEGGRDTFGRRGRR